MSEDLMLKCLIAFVLGYLVARMMRGNGLDFGDEIILDNNCKFVPENIKDFCNDENRKITEPDKCVSGLMKLKDTCIKGEEADANPDDGICLNTHQNDLKIYGDKRFCQPL